MAYDCIDDDDGKDHARVDQMAKHPRRDGRRQQEIDQRAVELGKKSQRRVRSEEHTSELQSLMRISYAVFGLKKQTPNRSSYVSTLTNHQLTLTLVNQHAHMS